MAGSDLLSVSWLLTPEQLRQGLTFQPIPVLLAVYAIFLSTDGLLMFLFTLLMNRYQNRLSRPRMGAVPRLSRQPVSADLRVGDLPAHGLHPGAAC